MLCPECGQGDLVRSRIVATSEIVELCPECEALRDVATDSWHELDDYLASRDLDYRSSEIQEVDDKR